MTDRELLQLAAKAAGYTLADHYDVEGRYWPWCHELVRHWCPLGDDGDTLRLAVKLRMSMYSGGAFHCIAAAWDAKGSRYEIRVEFADIGHEAAIRRAITLCAAEIGRRMG